MQSLALAQVVLGGAPTTQVSTQSTLKRVRYPTPQSASSGAMYHPVLPNLSTSSTSTFDRPVH